MLSRVADSIYWMNRYIERAENYARFIDANLNLTLDLPPGMAEQWSPLISTTGDNDLFNELFDRADKDSVLRFLISDTRNPSSIRSCLHLARENARSIREILSMELWEHLNEFFLQTRDATAPGVRLDETLRDPLPLCRMTRDMSHLYYGLFETTLSHGEGWNFGILGRQLERADQTSRLLDVKYFILLPRLEDVGQSFDLLQWSSLLKSASAYEMYNRTFDRIDPRFISRFLLFDREFPRSILFCIVEAARALRRITGSEDRSFSNPAEKSIGRLRSELEYTEIAEVYDVGMHEYLDRLQIRMNEIGQGLFHTYFKFEQ